MVILSMLCQASSRASPKVCRVLLRRCSASTCPVAMTAAMGHSMSSKAASAVMLGWHGARRVGLQVGGPCDSRPICLPGGR